MKRERIEQPMTGEKAMRLYGFIVEFYARHEYMPSIREMGEYMGIPSTSMVNDLLVKLDKMGWIERAENVGRGMRLTRPTERGLQPGQLRNLLGVELVTLDPPAFEEPARQRRKRARLEKVVDRKALIRQRVKPFGG